VTDSEITEQRPHAAAPGNAAPTNLMESGTNGTATINGKIRQNLGNLGCWGWWLFLEWWGGGEDGEPRSSKSLNQRNSLTSNETKNPAARPAAPCRQGRRRTGVALLARFLFYRDGAL
jgi:hypothetical protein